MLPVWFFSFMDTQTDWDDSALKDQDRANPHFIVLVFLCPPTWNYSFFICFTPIPFQLFYALSNISLFLKL